MTQEGRRRAELDPRHFVPDERDLADLILFGQRLARHIQYYDADNGKAGDWRVFFESDITANLAALSKLPLEAFRLFRQDLELWLAEDPARDPVQLSSHARLLFHLPVALLEMAGAHLSRLPGDHPLSRTAQHLAGRLLARPLTAWLAWYKGAIAVPGAGNALFDDAPLKAGEFNLTGQADDRRLRIPPVLARALFQRPALSAAPVPDSILAQFEPGAWGALYAAIPADPAPFMDAIGEKNPRYEQLHEALHYNLLTTAAEQLHEGFLRLRTEAAVALRASLETFAGHAPHYGLWLTFLQLFEHARNELNTFTGRHLDYYFREVLRLSNRPAAPDKVHLLLELAPGRETHPLTAGTLFRAGKDALGRPVAYALENNIVVNRARVVELRGVQVETGGATATPSQWPRAAQVVKSRDGSGAVALSKEMPSWPPFGPACSPAARIGFAVRDRKLFLREGTRTITLQVELKAPLASTGITPRWTVRLTSAKGWLELTGGEPDIVTRLENEHVEPAPKGKGNAQEFGNARGRGGMTRNVVKESREKPKGKSYTKSVTPSASAGKHQQGGEGSRGAEDRPYPILEITVNLGPDDPPVTPLEAKLHGIGYPPGLPVMEVLFDFSSPASSRAFAALRDLCARRVRLRTRARGLRNLMVVAADVVVDATKPFAPFGVQPRVGATWAVGSAEIFSKPLESCCLDLDWQTPWDDRSFFWKDATESDDPIEERLIGGRWVNARVAGGKGSIGLGGTGVEVALRGASMESGWVEQTPENPPPDATAVNGFIRLRLTKDFGHAGFTLENTRAMIGLAGGTAYVASSGVNTFKPEAGKSPSLPCAPYNPVITRLEAGYTTPLEGVEAFTHLHPFGYDDGMTDDRLFPEIPYAGALMIGVADFTPPARLTLLVQVADGSGSPLMKPPELEFAYLDNNRWVTFKAQDVDDKTAGFTRSGVLGLNLPEEADTNNRLLPAGLHWIRLAVTRNAEALNRLLMVEAQAVRAVFADAGNDPDHLETPLPAGSITRLVTPDLAIKKITQPFSSFGGRPVETAVGFATRVSERLRHKDRAVTLFDYESMVLEAFPRLHRVKCLNTTGLERNAAGTVVADNERKPGAVTVVIVPRIHGLNGGNPLRPYSDQATLTAVGEFLQTRISPFVRLEVQNPKFEEVQVCCRVRFRPDIGDFTFYSAELNRALIDFLSPWARPEGGDITFGGKLWKSSIIDFLDEQPRVDFVTEVQLYHKIDIDRPTDQWRRVDMEVIEATTARSILVSALNHIITEVSNHG